MNDWNQVQNAEVEVIKEFTGWHIWRWQCHHGTSNEDGGDGISGHGGDGISGHDAEGRDGIYGEDGGEFVEMAQMWVNGAVAFPMAPNLCLPTAHIFVVL